MAVPEPKPTETTIDDDSEDKSSLMKPVPVMTVLERQHFHELGLGRGIDSSDPQMWKNKSPMQMRTITEDLGNIIATDESGIKNSYEKTVASLKTQQTKIQSSLSDPTSQIKIGMDAQYSQSFSSTVTIKGTKVTTRTISFRHTFEDLPVNSNHNEVSALIPEDQLSEDSGYSTFENNLASWILEKLLDDQIDKRIPPTPDIKTLKGKTAIEKLGNYAYQIPLDSKEASAIELACRTFISEFGITHYVSGIELGALKYSKKTTRSKSSTVGLGSTIGAAAGPIVNVSASASTESTSTFMTSTKKEQEIGRFNDKGEVPRDSPYEAVIGFQIQPISQLVRVQVIRLAIITALEIYIQSKTADTSGPFLISASINKKPVYWKVDQERLSLIGTEDIKAASLFYIVSGRDQFSSSDFTIAYWGDKKSDRNLITNMTSRLTRLRSTIPKVPAFLIINTSLFCSSDASPLLFKQILDEKTTRYTAHSRVYSSFAWFTCVGEPVSLQIALEGDKFFFKHSPHALKSVYLALKQETGAAESPYYTSTVFPNIKYADKEEIGMLFRLHPYELREMIGKSSSSIGEVLSYN